MEINTVNSSATILFIEDSQLAVSMIRNALAQSENPSFEVVETETLSEGLKRLQAGGIDFVLLDLCLPDSIGLDTFGQVQNAAPEIPIVVRLTGTNETQARKILKKVNLKSADTLDNVVKEAIRLAGLDEIGAGRMQ